MITRIFTVYDEKTEAYLSPFFAMTAGEAERKFSDAVNDPSSMFNKHAADFTLFMIGTFDDSTALIVIDTPNNLCNAITLLQETQ